MATKIKTSMVITFLIISFIIPNHALAYKRETDQEFKLALLNVYGALGCVKKISNEEYLNYGKLIDIIGEKSEKHLDPETINQLDEIAKRLAEDVRSILSFESWPRYCADFIKNTIYLSNLFGIDAKQLEENSAKLKTMNFNE